MKYASRRHHHRPQADLNLGVDGVRTEPVVIDTTGPGSHKIVCVVSDTAGLTSTMCLLANWNTLHGQTRAGEHGAA